MGQARLTCLLGLGIPQTWEGWGTLRGYKAVADPGFVKREGRESKFRDALPGLKKSLSGGGGTPTHFFCRHLHYWVGVPSPTRPTSGVTHYWVGVPSPTRPTSGVTSKKQKKTKKSAKKGGGGATADSPPPPGSVTVKGIVQ